MSPEPVMSPRARAGALPAIAFLASLVALAAIAIVVLRAPPRIVTGLPDATEVAAARALVDHGLGVEPGELRFVSALLGEAGGADPALATGTDPAAEDERALRSALGRRPRDPRRVSALAAEAERALEPALRRSPRDPRLLAAMASLSLAAHRHAHAERQYRQALDHEPGYGEARLGLGVTLALRAAAEGDDARARGLRLRAISQFASVPEADPCAEAALYDRALLLARVGRRDEARRRALEYLARDSASAWASVLRRELDVAPR